MMYHAELNSTRSSRGCSIPFMFLVCAPIMATKMAWAAQWAGIGPLLESLLESWQVQLIQLIGPITGILVAPAVGVHSERSTSRFGQRRPYMFFGALATIVCWLIMPMIPTLVSSAHHPTQHEQTLVTAATIACYLWMDITVNMVQMAAYLLIADVAGDRQVVASSIATMYAMVGQLCVSVFIWSQGPAQGYLKWFFTMLVVVMLCTVLPVCRFVNEKPWKPTVDSYSPVPPKANVLTSVYYGVKSLPRQLGIFFLAFILTEYGFISYTGVKGQFFGIQVYGGSKEGADTCGSNCTQAQQSYNNGVTLAGGLTDNLHNIVGLFYLVVLPYLIKRFGARNVLMASMIPQLCFIVLALSNIAWLDVLIVVLTTITQQTIYSLQIPLILAEIGFGEEKLLGLYFGAMNTANCLGQLLNFAVTALVLRGGGLDFNIAILIGGGATFLALLASAFIREIAKMELQDRARQIMGAIELSDEEVANLCEIVVSTSPRMPLSCTIDMNYANSLIKAREERLRKDRLRKRKSKEKNQLELESLRQQTIKLQEELSRRKCKRPHDKDWEIVALHEKNKAQDAMKIRKQLVAEITHQLESAILYQRNLSWMQSSSPREMAIHPSKGPWTMHTLMGDSNARIHGVQAMMKQQLTLFTPELHGRLPESDVGGPFGLVLDDEQTSIAFLEMRKFGKIRAPFRNVALAFWTMVTQPTATKRITNFGDDLVLTTALNANDESVKQHVLIKLIHEKYRVIYLQRTINSDQSNSEYKNPVNVAAFWVFEQVDQGVCAMRGYTQVGLDCYNEGSKHDYTMYMNQSTMNNARLNDFMGQFDCILLN
ncbi:Glycoside-Pentoside-Hexuronide (GPH):Cation Symporter Family [Thraustotheca clavata]|uniref:Glycoside-Pentoside-Hexuronide (GPH):Cation Symporter Family n=1 Tax=Thraustotheca clavata TaxID=74557 RepID=A0A1W0A2C8_9STRA|nr:Glycoside-Pentoside-Hexuronide (GPH):Cation Symporter Family [Thraustotheca clavata]